MISIKQNNRETKEYIFLGTTYLILVFNLLFLKDNLIAVLSAFFGITYTFLAGKGNPKCYLFGLTGSGLYSWLAFTNALWGNLLLYACYFIPMQIIGFFKWNRHLKQDKSEIIKSKLSRKELKILGLLTIILCCICVYVLYLTNDKSPIIDGIATILSIAGMYLTVKRAIEQWIVWIIVNGITAIMWILILIHGETVYSAAFMWVVYFLFALYFFKEWRREVV